MTQPVVKLFDRIQYENPANGSPVPEYAVEQTRANGHEVVEVYQMRWVLLDTDGQEIASSPWRYHSKDELLAAVRFVFGGLPGSTRPDVRMIIDTTEVTA